MKGKYVCLLGFALCSLVEVLQMLMLPSSGRLFKFEIEEFAIFVIVFQLLFLTGAVVIFLKVSCILFLMRLILHF